MGAIEPNISAVNLLGKDDHISMIGPGDETEAHGYGEITCLRQADPDAVPGIGAIGNEICTFQGQIRGSSTL